MEVIKEEPFHFIFLDIYMTPFSGLDLCKEARKSRWNKNSFIYAYTAEMVQIILAKFYEAEFDDVIQKHVDHLILKKKMDADRIREKRCRILELYNENLTSRLVDVNEDFTLNNIPLELTKCEYKILKILAENRSLYLNSGEIQNILTGNFIHNNSSTVRDHISNIKTKFKAIESSARYIENYTEGYILKRC